MNAVRTLAAALALSAFATPVLAADWVADPAKSQIKFTGTQAGAPFTGRFARWDAKISFDPANVAAGHAEVTIETASAATGDAQKDEALPQSDWFNAPKFPQAKFEAKSFRAAGSDRYEAVGTLTIKGVTKDVVLPFTLKIAGDQAQVNGHLDIERSTYNVGEGAWAAPTFVGATVGIDIELSAKKK
ncbi:MAG TPA: YceI family protein [Candidatus Sulfotelmatobacter sp.]|nr:YceI family protein [Candidatus Sulfotelmatobacter sp.]